MSTLLSIHDPRVFLRGELERRSQRNPRFSQRAFARFLGVAPSTLSMLLSGERAFSRKMADRLAARLELSPHAKEQFLHSCLLSRFNKDGAVNTEKLGPAPAVGHHMLSLDHYKVIAEWHHYAILSLIETADFQPSPRWIAGRLGISEVQAKAATSRLVKLGVLDVNSTPWRQSVLPIRFDNKESTLYTRKAQAGILKKALESLACDPVEVRNFSAVTMAIDPTLLPYAKDEIKKFRRRLMAELERRSQPAREVYQLAIQIYPVTKAAATKARSDQSEKSSAERSQNLRIRQRRAARK